MRYSRICITALSNQKPLMTPLRYIITSVPTSLSLSVIFAAFLVTSEHFLLGGIKKAAIIADIRASQENRKCAHILNADMFYVKWHDLSWDVDFCLRLYRLKRRVGVKQRADSHMYNLWQCSKRLRFSVSELQALLPQGLTEKLVYPTRWSGQCSSVLLQAQGGVHTAHCLG